MLVLDGERHALTDAGYGVYETIVPVSGAGEELMDTCWKTMGRSLPDPCSRWQPEGLRGPSRVLDARALPGRARALRHRRPRAT